MKDLRAGIELQLAPGYIYLTFIAVLPAAALIDLFVAPSIYWWNILPLAGLAALYTCYLLFLAAKTGPFDTAPLWSKIARIITELLLLVLLSSNFPPLLDQMVKINSIPLADPWLAKIDTWIGFDWMAYFNFVHDRPWLIKVMDHAYARTGEMYLVLVLALILLRRFDRVRFYAEAATLTVFISILISTVTPAYAAVVYYDINFSAYPNFGFAPGVYHMENLLALRDASPDYQVGEAAFKGLVTFPSVHTALGVIMAGAVWRHWLFWPFALYAVVMIPSTPVLGGHYIIDVIAGAALSILVMVLLAKSKRYAGSFEKPSSPKAALAEA